MKKRILAIALALAVMLVSLPVLPLNLGISAGATAAPGDIELNPLTWPTWADDVVIHDFEGLTTDGSITNENGTIYTGVTSGISSVSNTTVSGLGYRDQYVGWTSRANNTLTLDGHSLVDTITDADNWFDFYIHMSTVSGKTYGRQFPSAQATALKMKIDLTGVTSKTAGSKVYFEIQQYISSGNSSGWTAYSDYGVTFYYLPDPTQANPNPEMQVLTSAGKDWHGTVWGYAGQSGTLIIPMALWDTKGFANYGGNTTIYDIHKYTDGYRQRSSLQIQTEYTNYAAGDVFKLDYIGWLQDYPISYEYETITQDFSNWTPNPNWTWMYGNSSAYGNTPGDCFPFTAISTNEGRLTLTPAATAVNDSSMHLTIDAMGNWDENYKAFAFDVDLSELTEAGDHYTRIYMEGRKGPAKEDTTSFRTYGGNIYLLGDDGSVRVLYNNSSRTDCFWTLPAQFKGRVVIPAETVHRTGGLEGTLHDDFKELALYFELRDWAAGDTGKSYYMDNFGYYYNAPGLEEGAGTDFSALENTMWEAETLTTENLRTFETWVKTTATKDQYFAATKYGGAHFRAGINAAGNPTFYLYDAETRTSINYTCTEAVVNDGEWKHVAFVIDETMMEIRCYVNGANMGSMDLAGTKIPTNGWNKVLTIGNFFNNNQRVNVAFVGTLANMRMWSDARTGAELYNNSIKSVVGSDNLIAEWMLTGEEFAAESTGKYDLVEYKWDITSDDDRYAQYNRDSADDEFSIIFLPDTQIINHYSATQFAAMYDWIIANQERLNIQAVMGLGDIVDQNAETVQWQNAHDNFLKLTNAGIPWVAVQGNHDYSSLGGRDYANFKKYFTMDMLYENENFQLGDTYYYGEYSSAYYYFTPSEDVKYILLALESEPRQDIVTWAKQVIESHPDHRVIVTTHEYMYGNGTLMSHNFGNMYTGSSSGEQVWEKVLAPYKNVDMVLAGHVSVSSIVSRVDKGVNGNDILQILCDTQQIDYSYAYAGAVLIARFKNDGSQVSFNLYSTNADSFMGNDNNDLVFDLGSQDDELEESVAADSYPAIDGIFHSQKIIHDFNTVKATEVKSGGDNSQEKDSEAYGTWNKGSLKVTYDVTDKVDSTTGETVNGTKGWFNFTLRNMPKTVKGDGYTAVAFHIDATGMTKDADFRTYVNMGGGSMTFDSSGTYFKIDDATGACTQHWGRINVKKGWKGFIVIPFINETFGTTDPDSWKGTTAGLGASIRMQNMSGNEGDSYVIDEYSYLQGGPLAVPFKNFDGNVLDTVIINPGADITSKLPANPSRHGYVFTGWENIENPAAYEVFGLTALYEKDTTTEYAVAPSPEAETDIQIKLPENKTTAYYNDRVTLRAPAVNAAGQKFAYWNINGSKFSFSKTLSFLVFDELNIEAVYADEVEENPVVIYTNTADNYVIDGTKWNMQIMGVVSAGEKEVTEIGILLGASAMTAEQLKAGYEANDGTVYKMVADNAVADRQFLFTIKGIAMDRTRCATTYAIIDGELVIGEAVTCITMDANGSVVA